MFLYITSVNIKEKMKHHFWGERVIYLELESDKAKTAGFGFTAVLLCGIRQFPRRFAYENLSSDFLCLL